MKKITLIALLLVLGQMVTAQTPCGTLSPLDCSEVDVSLATPFNLTFDGTEGGINTTGFTMVDPPSSPLTADETINDLVIPGLISANLSVSGGALNVTATNGINFSQLSGTPSSTFTNSQMNALGVGVGITSNVVDITATMAQPNFAGSTNNGGTGSQQAGIWFGLNENNFAKLVLVKSSGTQQKVQLALEQGDGTGNTTNLTINELNTNSFNIAGVSTIAFRISVDPSDNSVSGFYSIDGAAEIQVGGDGVSLTAPAKFITGADHDSNIATDALTYAGIMTTTRRSTGGSLVVSYNSFGVAETAAPIEVHVNFMSDQLNGNSGGVLAPPTGYDKDIGEAFAVNQTSDGYSYGWRRADDLTPINTTGNGGAGRNRIGNTYNTTTDINVQLEGTLMHFQGDNISSWSGQNRGNELIWEVAVPNGTYLVTIGIGDASNSVDSRHSAAIEGYTIIPAFRPTPGEVKVATMIVEVEDAALTMSGLGGYNSKITHIDIIESTGTPVNGELTFDPAASSESLEAGTTGSFISALSGAEATDIALIIDDDGVNGTADNFNDWLSLPATDVLGDFTFGIDASALVATDTRDDRIIATAAGFKPAVLDADLTVTEAPVVPISTPFRMNVAGGEYTLDGDLFEAEDTSYLVGTSETSTNPYVVVGGNEDLYIPRRFGPDFGYAFPLDNGDYQVVLHMVENFQTASNARIFDVIMEDIVVIDDIDLFVTAGEKTPYVESFNVTVADGELNVDFLASINGGILMGIEILPAVQSDATEILTFAIAGETGSATIDTDNGTVTLEVANGTGLTGLVPTITLSAGATIAPLSGVAQDFDAGAVSYTVTAEDGSTVQEYEVTVTEALAPFAALINFQNNPSGTTPPTGYLPDYGKQFGNASVTVNSTDYDYGWKLLATDAPWDASDEAASNSTGVGRMRLGNITNYNNASDQEKLEGTLVHFQGDNIAGWGNGQPRKNELYWELEVPNGIYEVTLGLGDKQANQLDSRHTATLEGYTIIPAFRPSSTETRVATMIVEVTDGALTMNGLGGFNSKITHIEVVESTGTPATGELVFSPNTASPSLAAGETGSFVSTLSGDGATAIALNIEDDPVNTTADNFNDWLSLPTTDIPGEFTFAIDASALAASDTRNDKIIATAAGFKPAILDADLTVTEGLPNTFSFIEDFDGYTPSTGDLAVLSNGDWVKQSGDEGLADIPVLEDGLTPNTTHSLSINNASTIAVHDFQKLIDAPVALEANVPFYYGTYFQITDLGTNNNNRIRVAIRVDDSGGEAAAWVRQMISRNGNNGPLVARLGLAGSNAAPVGEVGVDPDQVLQFVVKGVWDGAGTISYEYTIAPTLVEGDNTWVAATASQSVTGTPELGRIFISSTSTANNGKIGPIRLSTDYAQVVTEEIIVTTPPVVLDQEFDITEIAVVGDAVGTVVATDADTDVADLDFAITSGNEAGDFTINQDTGEITTVNALDFAVTPQYVLTVEVSDGTNASSAEMTIDLIDVCNPLSILPCDAVVVSLPVNLDFSAPVANTIFDTNASGTGFTAVLEHSEARRAGDLAISNPRINGYEPSLLTLGSGTLAIQSQAGIAYLDPDIGSSNNNNQVNTLGIGLDNLSETITIKTTLLNIVTGGDAAQAGLWYGFDENNFVKLDINNNNVELRVERAGASANNNTDQLQVNASASGNDVVLEMVIDPTALSVEAFYTVGAGTRTSLGTLLLPANYFTGRDINAVGGQDNVSFAGIFATHRNGSQFTATFDDFSVEADTNTNIPPVVDDQIFTVSELASIGDAVDTVVATDADTDVADLDFAITAGNEAGDFTINQDSGEITTVNALDFDTTPQYILTVEVSDGDNQVEASITINVEEDIVVPPVGDFAFIEDFDYSLGDLETVSGGAWIPENSKPDLPVVATSIATGVANSVRIENDNTVIDYQTLINNPVALEANVPFYYGTYFKVEALGASEGNRIRVAIRVDDDGGEGTAWVRHIIGNYGGTYYARLGLATSNSNMGQTEIAPDQLLQFVVKGVWDGAGTISYEYTIAPTLAEGDNSWIAATEDQTVVGIPELGRIFISTTSTANTGNIGPIRLSTDYTEVVTEEITEEASPCSPFSTLPCDQIVTSNAVSLSFDGTEGGLSDTGFTMVDPYSGTRVAEDGTPSNTDVPGYEPGNLALTGDNLVISANKGIAYLDNNAQINTLGVGLQNITSTITLETKLLGITTGGSSAQAGIWFGIDDENFVKLNVNNNNIEMRREIGGASANGADSPDQIQVNALGVSGQDVTLRLVVDPEAETLTAFYSLDDTNFTQLVKTNFDDLVLPAAYLSGKEINGEVGNASFAGVYATYRSNASSFDATFDYFTISEDATLSFDVTELSFSGEQGSSIAPQTATLTASEGSPAIILSDDPDSASWLILPENPVLGDLEFGIEEGLAPGNYSTTIFAIEQPADVGYTSAELQITLEITEPVNDFAVNINFSDPATAPPADYERDSGDPYGDRGNDLTYGWLTLGDAPIDLTTNTRNRNSTVSLLEKTLIHMQYGDTGGSNGVATEGKWEIEVPNGSYNVVVSVGDPSLDGTNPVDTTPFHSLNAEGTTLVDRYTPVRVANDPEQFTTGSAVVSVEDGRLTLDATGGFNTKINYVQITATAGGVQTPRVVGVDPDDGAIGVPVNTSISANDLFLPNLDSQNNAGVDNNTITTTSVKLIKVSNGNQVLASVNGTGGGDAINLVPSAPLEANTEYRFEIEGVLDLVGEPFEAFASTFTTGSGNTGPVTDLDNVSFSNEGAVASGEQYTTLTIGPDGKLYGLQINGDIDRWTIESDGTLSGKEDLNAWKGNYGNSRTSVGLTFDPDATAQNLIAYISHNSGGLSGAPAWDGKISRLTGDNLQTEVLVVTNLPRSTKDHLTNSITFRPGENNVLYFNQGSNTAGGAPDNSWGQRKERLLSAAALRLDLDKLPEGQWPLNAKTTMDPATINEANVNSPTLASPGGTTYSESGQNNIPDDGTYNPYYFDAPLTLFGTGVRNAYDLVWHSNGQLYIPTNGTAAGSNAPASIDDTRRPDGSIYDHDDISGNYPVIPASNSNNTQKDWLFRLNPSNPLGYYGHPNPLRGEFVLNRGDADVNQSGNTYDGVQPDINYRGAAFDFENNKSPNGVIEYKSNAENGNLTGALLVVRYSGGSDIIALVPDGPNGDINTFKIGIPGFTGFNDPLDLVEDVTTGNIYVSDYGQREIILLRPSAQASPEALIVLDAEEVVGDAITSNDFTQEILLSNLGNANLEGITAEITGPDSDQFSFNGLASSLNPQNSDAFNVVFSPTSNGPKFAQLTISGTDVDDVVIPLNGLGKQGTGGSNEPSLQWILDTQLGAGAVNVGDEDPATNIFNPANGLDFNDLLGDELDIQSFERAIDAPVTLELLSVYGPTGSDPVVAFGWYETGNASATNELFTVDNTPVSNGQRLNPPLTGLDQFDPGTQAFGFYSRWPAFQNRQLYSEDVLNTFTGNIPHHVRVYALPGETDAYIIATEEHITGFDYQDIVVIARNIRPADNTPALNCAPISLLDCEEIPVALPYSLTFDGTEGGLSNTGFTMVDNPTVRLAADLPISHPDVLGYEPGKISLTNGNLILEANNGIAYRTEGSGGTQSTDVNSQVNTLGVGFDATSYGSFSITTTIVNPYTDGSNDSEQAGIWFGLDEDNFVKLVANSGGQVELRSETNGISAGDDQEVTSVAGLNTSTVQLRLFVDVDNNLLVPHYTINGGTEVAFTALPLPASYLAGNAAYDDQSFAGIFATKRREAAATVTYTFEDFAITPENSAVALRINAGGTTTYTDAQSNVWELDETFLTGNSEVSSKIFDVAGTTEDDLFLEYRFSNDDAAGSGPGAPFGYSIPVTGAGPYTVKLYFLEPFFGVPGGGAGGTGVRVFDVDIEGGQGSLSNYDLTEEATPGTLITETFSDITVTDGNLTIDFTATTNNAIISAIEIIGGQVGSGAFFTNVNPADNSNGVAITDFQITVSVNTPEGYELDEGTIAGNVNLYRVVGNDEILVPSNSNDTGGGDAITLTPLSDLQPFTDYVFRTTNAIEANLIGDLTTRIPFQAFRSDFTTGDGTTVPDLDLTGVEFTQVALPTTEGERFSSLVIGPDGKLYGSTIGDFQSDGRIFRWDMAADGTLENEEILTPQLLGSPDPEGGSRPGNNNERLIIGLVFDPSSTAENLIAYVTHSQASDSDGPEWDGKLTRLSGPTLSDVQDIIVHLPRSKKDHLTNSVIFDDQGDLYINQGSNSAGGAPDAAWDFRPEKLLSAAILKVELDKLPNTLPLSAYTTDDIAVINAAPSGSILMSDNTYNPFSVNSPLTIFASGVRNAYDFVWHSNGWLYIPTNGTAGNNNSSPNSPAYTIGDPLARRIDGLGVLPNNVPALNGGETQKDWLFKSQGGSYHGHPNPLRGEFVLNHGGAPYSGVPGQESEPATDVSKYPDNLGPDPNYREPAYDFGFNKSPNGAIEYQSDAFGGKLQGLLMVVRFSGQDDIIVLQPQGNGDIANANGDVPGLQGFDDPLDVVEDPNTGNMYVSEYDRGGNTNVGLVLLRANVQATRGPKIVAAPEELIFEVTNNTNPNEGEQTDTKVVEVTNDGNEVLNITGASFTGTFASQFTSVTPSGVVTLQPGESQDYTVVYAAGLDGSALGYQEAALLIESDDPNNPSFEIGLHGLKKAGYEGNQEPPLQDVVDALGIGIDVGWTSLSNGTNPAPVGDELEDERWVKAGNEPVTLVSVGRYSPAETLPFGWYTNIDGSITTNEVGVQADGIDNAQTLFPILESGDTSFDPQGAVFGIYTESNFFNRFNYTEDGLNAIQTSGVTHRTRIYPNRDRDGNPIENSYLIAFEDAANGDYQDYLFILSNVEPFVDGSLVLDFTKESLDYIVAVNQEDIPVQQISLTATGGVVSSEITLESSEDWVILPENFNLSIPFDVGIDNTGLGIGSYTATVTASSPNYEDATFDINLEITNELVYTYQFNFRTPDPNNIEPSPSGYVDDIGTEYGVQSTILGDVTYGWVLPGTLTPAGAETNVRNRPEGIGDGILLQTLTILGHRNDNSFPYREWVVDLPNGTYSVNLSVGDATATDSNHVLDANGTEIINYNQEADPSGPTYSSDTSIVEVTDGILRLGLGTGGVNVKLNYIRLAPVNTALIPPTIVATFDGNQSDEDTYRGAVDITLEATDESGSGSIVRLEYNLDDAGVEEYTEPLNVSDVGPHTLVVTAEDANGNITEQTFNFNIETPSGALLAIENMTKIPGTDRGFPADDYYTFYRLGQQGGNGAQWRDFNTMRLNNTGSGDLVVSEIIVSDPNDYTFEILDANGETIEGPGFTVPVGSYVDLPITFIGTTGNGNNGLFLETIQIISNADNALENQASLHGGYAPQPEGGDEINGQEVFDVFGFQSSMLSIVNDEGTISPPNNVPFRPSSNYPLEENINAGYEGDMILPSAYVVADPSQPVYGLQLSALHGTGSANARFIQVGADVTVGGINFAHSNAWYQSLLPVKSGETDPAIINFDSSTSINQPFRIQVAGYRSSGGQTNGNNADGILGLRVYRVIDHNGNVIPNEYLVMQDYIGSGCGAGGANCDWNDNTFYFTNIRPLEVPTAQPIEDLFVAVGSNFSVEATEAFDIGYAGNKLTYAASYEGGALPSWININPLTGLVSGNVPNDASGSFQIDIDGVDSNGLIASTSVTITIDEAPIAEDDEIQAVQGVPLLLENLLANDSEPNGQDLTITLVSNPGNGTAELNEGENTVLYTANGSYVGPDSFTYTIEDENGLSATADVLIDVVEENLPPTAVATSNINEGIPALIVQFSGDQSTDDNNAISGYLWNFGDGSATSNAINPEHTYTSAGNFTATLTVTDAGGLQDQAQVSITVSSLPNIDPVARATSDVSTGDAPLVVGLSASTSEGNGDLTYLWDFGDNTATSTAEEPEHVFTAPGTYTVSLSIEDAEGLTDNTTLEIVVTGDPVACGPVPDPWTSSDIGNVAAAGSACFDDGTFQVEASGRDIWDESDEFHFVYQPLTGDGEIIARVLALDATHPWAKAGVMMRNTTAPNSAQVLMSFSPNPVGDGLSYTLQDRPTAGANMTPADNNLGPVPIDDYPHYVRLVREGNTFIGYASDSNGNWEEIGRKDITMGETIQVGLATTSHNDGVITNAIYDNVSVIPADGGNTPPVAAADSDIISGLAPLTVNFNSDDSTDDKAITSYLWDFDDDGATSALEDPSHTFDTAGVYQVSLRVEDAEGAFDTATI
uniref:PKD domain-containing protein n=1 Tax=Eudoraea chungangensis TaxID=1481905 RepID=UPI0023ED937A